MQGSGGALECGLGSLWDEGWLCGAGGSETPLCRAGQRSDELRSSGDVTNVASPGGWPCGTEPAADRRASEDRRIGEFRRRHPPPEYGFLLDSALPCWRRDAQVHKSELGRAPVRTSVTHAHLA